MTKSIHRSYIKQVDYKQRESELRSFGIFHFSPLFWSPQSVAVLSHSLVRVHEDTDVDQLRVLF